MDKTPKVFYRTQIRQHTWPGHHFPLFFFTNPSLLFLCVFGSLSWWKSLICKGWHHLTIWFAACSGSSSPGGTMLHWAQTEKNCVFTAWSFKKLLGPMFLMYSNVFSWSEWNCKQDRKTQQIAKRGWNANHNTPFSFNSSHVLILQLQIFMIAALILNL